MFVADPRKLASQFRSWARIPALRRIIVSHVDVIDLDPRAVLEAAARDYD